MLCTGIAYCLFFRLIQRVGAPRASTTTYLVPIFGVAWGWLLLGEQPTWTMIASAALILGSVILSQREAKPVSSVVADTRIHLSRLRERSPAGRVRESEWAFEVARS